MELNIENNINNLDNEQTKFLDTVLGSAINNGIDIGIRCLLPDYAENIVIDIKNNIFKYGIKDGISQIIKNVIDFGKNAAGIFHGKFENIGQITNIIKNGGIIDSISELLDDILYKLKSKGKINSNIYGIIKSGKNVILNNVEKNIEATMTSQIKSSEYLNKYIDNWKTYFKEQNFNGMENELKKIKTKLKDMVPIENSLNDAHNIELLHALIKNKNGSFNLETDEIELVNKLSLS